MLKRDDPETIAEFETDESGIFRASGVEAVYFPETTLEVAELLQAANDRPIAVTISGGGTGLTGGRVATCGGWILSTREMRIARPFEGLTPEGSAPREALESHRLETEQYGQAYAALWDPERLTALVPAGMTLEILGQLLPAGVIYPPDPTERTATIGGTIATNASGARSFHYGATRRWIEALEIVLPTGEPIVVERGAVRAEHGRLRFTAAGRTIDVRVPSYRMPAVKNAAGLYATPEVDLVDLLIGAEGILGVVTQARLRLTRLEEAILSEIAFFNSLEEALSFTEALRAGKREGLRVLSIEFFDNAALRFMQHPSVRGEYAAAIYTEIVGTIEEAEALLAALEEHNVAQDWFAETEKERQEQKEFRHSLPEGVNAYLRRQGSHKLGTDFAVPAEQFPRLLQATREAAEAFRQQFPRAGEHAVTWGHIGDYHLHFNFLAQTPEEHAAATQLYVQLAQEAVRLGGTISAEHGVGKKIVPRDGQNVPYLQLMYGEEGLREIAAVKQAFDPLWILNRGNMIPTPS